MERIIIGIDPGASGGFAMLNKDGVLDYIKTPKSAGKIDVTEIVNTLNLWRKFASDANTPLQVFIEDVHALHGSSAASTFTFGISVGILKGIIGSLGLSTVYVQPKKWQSFSWKGIKPQTKMDKGRKKVDTKKTSLLAAKTLFPTETFIPINGRVPHDGIIDAVLIGYYGLIGYLNE